MNKKRPGPNNQGTVYLGLEEPAVARANFATLIIKRAEQPPHRPDHYHLGEMLFGRLPGGQTGLPLPNVETT
jgi:hypothetical protein